MKKLLPLMLVLGSLSAYSAVIEDNRYNPCYQQNALGCALSTTFSLPVLIIADGEVLEGEELNMLILAEMESGETALTQAVADKMGVSIEEVQQTAVSNY
mgnify:CR=1 FL=1